MLHDEALGLLLGSIALGFVHGIEPGHGWPVAASYALNRANKWLYGFVAGFVIGVGHLVSSIAMVAVFFYAKSYFSLTQVNEPIVLVGVRIGGPVSLVAGVLLIALGIREYRHGHSHDHTHGEHAHNHSEHVHTDHEHDGYGHADHTHDGHYDHAHEGVLTRLKGSLPFVGGRPHDHGGTDETTDRGLLGIAWFAFVLGFAHEEEFEIIALCAGSNHCLSLMGAYALAVIVGIVGLTLLLIAGYERHEERAERYAEYLPLFSAVVLVLMGLGFITGVF